MNSENMNKNELIKVTINEEGKQLVSARELHEFLEIGTRFNDWFSRMVEYGFAQDVDYEKIINEVCTQKRVRTYEQVDYAISLDMAKEISMIQRSEKGKQARLYFIECEKQLKEVVKITKEDELILNVVKAKDVGTRMIALSEYGEYKENRIRAQEVKPLQEEVKKLSPKQELALRLFDGGIDAIPSIRPPKCFL